MAYKVGCLSINRATLYLQPDVEKLYKPEFKQICTERLQEHPDAEFISRVMNNVDFAFAEVVLELGAPLTAYLNSGTQGLAYPWEVFKRYKAILDQAKISICKDPILRLNQARVHKDCNFIIKVTEMARSFDHTTSADILLRITGIGNNKVLERKDKECLPSS